MSYRIALIGNPNCGKTTLYNAVTGSTQYVGNWPGVTVEKKEGVIKNTNGEGILVDLPGIYSLAPYSLEEKITRNFLTDDRPDSIINIMDAANLERSLYLTTQLVEMGIPVVVALNMIDVTDKAGDHIDEKKLANQLGCPIIRVSATEGTGIKELIAEAVGQAQHGNAPSPRHAFTPKIETAIDAIADTVKDYAGRLSLRWTAVNLFGRDQMLIERLALDAGCITTIETAIGRCEKEFDDDSESIIANERYKYIDGILTESLNRGNKSDMTASDRIDKIVTNRLLGLPIFFLIMWGVYYVSIQTLGDMTIGWIETFFGGFLGESITAWFESMAVSEWLISLVVDGIIGGVGAVLGFVPQLMILFFFVSFLEDCGYMARVAFIMDRVFRQFGLSGKSFIPMVIGTGCSVPGIMASRTIENDMDRKMTIMLTPFVPCSAKLPVFALFTATFFPHQTWVGPSMYILGIGMVIISGIILKKTRLFAGDPAPFVMELPSYRMPRVKGVLNHMWDRAKAFIIKAGTIIFVAAAIIWFLQSFNWSLEMVEGDESILASVGNSIKWIFAPLGFGNWQAAMAIVTGFLAKEVIVSTFGIIYGLGEVSEDNPELLAHISQMFTPISAYAFMVFALLASPCAAALGATKSEMGSWKWLFISMAWQTGMAYVVALIIYQVGSRILA